jgi:hypothetical protein
MEVKEMILKAYLKGGARPAVAQKVDEPKVSKPPKPIPVDNPRTLGDITTAMMAQQIYNPGAPPAPKSPSKAMQGQGTAPAMGMQGPWGKPEDK